MPVHRVQVSIEVDRELLWMMRQKKLLTKSTAIGMIVDEWYDKLVMK